MPDGPRLSSWSPRWTRSADSAWDTAGSLTPSALAAAVTEPSLATSTKALSCVSVMTLPIIPQIRPCHDASYTAEGVASGSGEAALQVPAYVEDEKATSLDHALNLLARFGPEAKVLAGGHSLIPMMKLRLAQPETLIDINGLTELSYVTVTGTELRIGAMTRHAQLLDSAETAPHLPILHDAEQGIADPVGRKLGTGGGS